MKKSLIVLLMCMLCFPLLCEDLKRLKKDDAQIQDSGEVHVRSQGANGVRVSASETDLGGDKVLYTPCWYWFVSGNSVWYSVGMTHDENGSPRYFDKWMMGNNTLTYSDEVLITANSGYIYIDCYYSTSKKTDKIVTRTTVEGSYVYRNNAVTVSPADRNGDSSGTTSFIRYFNAGTTVTYTAPMNYSNYVFAYWRLYNDTVETKSYSNTATFNSSDYDTAICHYIDTADLNTLNVLSSGVSNVAVSIVGLDVYGNGDGTTPFARLYQDESSITLTAPGTSGGKYFSHWSSGGNTYESRGLSITFGNGGTTNVTAVYDDTPPALALSRENLYFGVVQGGANPPSQTFIIRGNGDFDWSLSGNYDIISASPVSGTGDALVTVTLDMTQGSYDPSTYTANMGVTATGDTEAEAVLTINLEVLAAADNQAPFGDILTPVDSSTVASSVAVTGWALDDTAVANVKLYAARSTDSGVGVYIGDAVLVEGARADLESQYPTTPGNYQAGWGYMMLTNFLPYGDATYKITAIASDSDGLQTTLGSKTITVDNATAVKPFGAIDTPLQGGSASGASYRNNGWVLTPLPSTIPTDGSTIKVYIDSTYSGKCNYNIARSDIAGFFPGYNNTSGPAAQFIFDTTGYAIGVHSIYWIATDDGGNADGIGSRFFVVNNGASSRNGSLGSETKKLEKKENGTRILAFDPDEKAGSKSQFRGIPLVKDAPVIKKGFDALPGRCAVPAKNGDLTVSLAVGERLEIRPTYTFSKWSRFEAQLKSGSSLKPLPVGASIDAATGILSWLPVAGFHGEYTLFISS
ncbi:MAG: hypothetical protein GY765_14250, partial [bacterium]|nr:hypothetical protein [bacterium]